MVGKYYKYLLKKSAPQFFFPKQFFYLHVIFTDMILGPRNFNPTNWKKNPYIHNFTLVSLDFRN